MDVQVNAGEWNGLSQEDREKIQAIIAANFKETKITADPGAMPAVTALSQPMAFGFNLGKPLCMASCGVAEAAAVAACAALSGPAVAVCVAAAHAAGELCRKQC